MVNRGKEKGDRLERRLVDILLTAGFMARRTPMSGSGPKSANKGSGYDVSLSLFDKVYKVEAKSRGVAFQTFYKWLTKSDMVVIKQNHEEALVVLPLRLALELMTKSKDQQKTDFYANAVKITKGLLTPNEARKKVGLRPVGKAPELGMSYGPTPWNGQTCKTCGQTIKNSSCACGIYGTTGHQCDPGSKGK